MKTKIFLFIALIISVLVNAQGRAISGKITDNSGSAIAGVNVSTKGTLQGTTSDLNGKYSIKVNAKGAILQFAFVGYVTQNVKVGTKDTLNITLKEDVQKLEEVVVSDYEIQGKVAGVQVDKKSKIRGTALPSMGYDVHSIPAPQMPPRMAPEAVSDNEDYKF
jgi:uncharacterized protein YuzE